MFDAKERLEEEGLKLDPIALNEARWAACNTPWVQSNTPSMEEVTEVADRAVIAYLLSEDSRAG